MRFRVWHLLAYTAAVALTCWYWVSVRPYIWVDVDTKVQWIRSGDPRYSYTHALSALSSLAVIAAVVVPAVFGAIWWFDASMKSRVPLLALILAPVIPGLVILGVVIGIPFLFVTRNRFCQEATAE